MALSTVPTKGSVQLTSTDWNSFVRDNTNELIGRSSLNHLVNGRFGVWQRGPGPFAPAVSTPTYTTDRWVMDYTFVTSGSMTVTQETTTVDTAGDTSCKVVASAGLTSCRLRQKVEHFAQLRGKTIAVSLRVNQGAANSVTMQIDAGVAVSALSATVATTGAWTTITLVYTVPTNATQLEVQLRFLASTTSYVQSAMLVVGPAATEFVPEHPQQELARCQRYYEVHGGATGAPFFEANSAAGGNPGMSVQFSTPKGGTPTVTKSGTWGVINCGQPSPSSPTATGYVLRAAASAAGQVSFNPNSSDDIITAEFNP